MFSMIFPSHIFYFAVSLLLYSSVFGFCPRDILFYRVQQGDGKQKMQSKILCLRELDFLVEPIGAFDVPGAAQEQSAGIEQISTPSHREGAMLVENGVTHIDRVEEKRKEFEGQCGARVARARDAVEKNETRDENDETKAQYPKGGDAGCNGGRFVGENADDGCGENQQNDPKRNDGDERHLNAAFDHGSDGFAQPRSEKIGGESGGGGRKSHEGNKHEIGNGAHHIGSCEFARAQMLHSNEENEPSGERKEVLHHRPNGDVEHFAEKTPLELGKAVEGKLAIVDFPPSVGNEKEHRKSACHRRGDGSSSNAQLRKSTMAENEQIVEHNIAQHHHNSVEFQRARLCGGNEKGAKQTSYHTKIDAPHAPLQIGPRRFKDFRRTDEMR